MPSYTAARMIYRIPEGWVEQRRRTARWAAPLIGVAAMGIMVLALAPRVNWSQPQDRNAAMFVFGVVGIGALLGILAGRFSFRTKMKRWETFSVEVTSDELIRQMDGQETRIQRANVKSIREYPQRGFVIIDNLGWQIFVPKMVANYPDFRERILAWTHKSK
jgi:hypothetical protein